uniref:Uncharacterized protein n=1 Tax=Romanomermis culicivorax TaxID=13658 RepID=A0A915I0E5_ROMCU
MPIMASTNKR